MSVAVRYFPPPVAQHGPYTIEILYNRQQILTASGVVRLSQGPRAELPGRAAGGGHPRALHGGPGRPGNSE